MNRSLQSIGHYVLVFLGFFTLLPLAKGQPKLQTDPKLTIKSPTKTVVFSRSQLLQRPDLTEIEINEDPTYPGKRMHYSAVPVYALFQAIAVPRDAAIQFRCLDGFSAPIANERLLNQKKSESIAYIAIEKPNESWPSIKPPTQLKTAGPFYLVWQNAKASSIGQEEWPFQLVGFEISKSLSETYPAIFPDSQLSEQDSIVRGFKVFTKNCFVCHTLNLQGLSRKGPDLNVPNNPTEYFKDDFLKALIRNPQNLRIWPNSGMSGFAEKEMTNDQLTDLLNYLKHMAKRKVKP